MVILGGIGAAGALVVGYALWPSTRIGRADAMAANAGERFVSSWIKIGQDAANSIVKKCEADGSTAPDAYRPKTKPGVYVSTALTVGSVWPQMKPFVLKEPSQFRTAPPVGIGKAP